MWIKEIKLIQAAGNVNKTDQQIQAANTSSRICE